MPGPAAMPARSCSPEPIITPEPVVGLLPANESGTPTRPGIWPQNAVSAKNESLMMSRVMLNRLPVTVTREPVSGSAWVQ